MIRILSEKKPLVYKGQSPGRGSSGALLTRPGSEFDLRQGRLIRRGELGGGVLQAGFFELAQQTGDRAAGIGVAAVVLVELFGFAQPAGAQGDHPAVFLIEGGARGLVGIGAVNQHVELMCQHVAILRRRCGGSQGGGQGFDAGGGGGSAECHDVSSESFN